MPLFVVWMAIVGCSAFLLALTNPTLSLGRDLSALSEEEKVAVLAMVDQMKISRYMPDEGPLVLKSPRDRNNVLGKACAELGGPLASAMMRAVLSTAHSQQALRCDKEIGYFFYKSNGEYQAGFQCRGWCGSGHDYVPVHVGPVMVLLRLGEFLM